jgi:ribosomal protein S18 acetylase RimI-like enzyme
MQIRPYAPSDQQAVVALWQEIFAYEAAHHNPLTVIQHKMAVQPDLFFVTTFEGEVVGTVMGGYDGHRGWIYSLAVTAAHRRKGIGAALVRHVEAALSQQGCLKINLQVLASNSKGLAFYRKRGYRIEERISMGKIL